MRNSLFILLFTYFIGCGQSSSNSIPTLPLPLVLHCGFHGPYLRGLQDTVSTIFQKSAAGWHLAGRIENPGENVALLYFVVGDLQCPFIITYDVQGNRIDSLDLLFGDCFDQPNAIDRTTTTVLPTHVVQMIDSLFVVKNPSNHSHQEYSLQVKMREYELQRTGRFNVLSDTTYMIGSAKAPEYPGPPPNQSLKLTAEAEVQTRGAQENELVVAARRQFGTVLREVR